MRLGTGQRIHNAQLHPRLHLFGLVRRVLRSVLVISSEREAVDIMTEIMVIAITKVWYLSRKCFGSVSETGRANVRFPASVPCCCGKTFQARIVGFQ